MASTLTGTDITVSIDGGKPLPCDLRVERQTINVSTATARKPDLSWTFVDSAGHFHAFDHEGKLPTIVYREERIEFVGDPSKLSEEWDDYIERDDTIAHVECGLCGEKVELKYVPTDPTKLIPGRVEYTVTVRGAVPAGRFSVLVTTPKRLFFGFAESVSANWAAVTYEPIHEVVCGPMSWRPAPEPPEEPKPDVWVGLRQRTEEGRNR